MTGPNRFIAEVRGGVELFFNRGTDKADGWWWGSDEDPWQRGPFASSEKALEDARRGAEHFKLVRWDEAELKRPGDRPLPRPHRHRRHRRQALGQNRRAPRARRLQRAHQPSTKYGGRWSRAASSCRPARCDPTVMGCCGRSMFSANLRRGIEMKPRLYVNPNAPQDLKDTFADVFPDVERAAPELIEQLVGGFTDDGPPVSVYAAALVDETGKLTLIGGPETPGFDSV